MAHYLSGWRKVFRIKTYAWPMSLMDLATRTLLGPWQKQLPEVVETESDYKALRRE